jgi:hypothetical protein
MPLFDNVRLLGSALLPRRFHVQGLAAAGAMLICVAVVFDVGQFCKAQKTSGLPIEHAAAAPTIVEQPDLWRSFPRTTDNFSEPLRDLIQTASISVADAAPWMPRPANAKDAGEFEGRAPREHAGSAEPATQPYADQAGSELAKSDVFVGVWAPDAGTCSARNFRDGDLPTVISTDGAWAGETFCMFTKKKQTETGWRIVAKCSSPRERWTANVRLTVNDSRLTWTSERGSQVYTRCRPDILTAQAR